MDTNANTSADQHTDAVRAPADTADSDRAAQFLEDLSAHPGLAMHKLMSTARRNALGVTDTTELDTQLEPGFGPEFDEAVERALAEVAANGGRRHEPAGRPTRTRLPGSIIYNKTGNPARRDVNAAPTKSAGAAMMAAEHLAHDILAIGLPNALEAQTAAFSTLSEPVKTAFARHGLDRRGAVVMEAAARYLVHHTQPAKLRFLSTGRLRREADDLMDAHSGHAGGESAADDENGDEEAQATTAGLAVERLTRRPRIVWSHPDGIHHGLMVDRLHHTHLAGLTSIDQWTARKVAEDIASIDALLSRNLDPQTRAACPSGVVLGVRVLTHLCPNAGVHFKAQILNGRAVVGAHHRVGECDVCAPVPHLPNDATINGAADSNAAATSPPAGTRAPVVRTTAAVNGRNAR